MEKYRELGFKSKDEQELYEDVCCELNNVKNLDKEEDAIKLLKRINNIDVPTKQDYEEFINKKGLNDLFEKVKPMTLLDRYVELYIYHVNSYTFYLSMSALDFDNAKKLDPSENMSEIIKNIDKAMNKTTEAINHLHCVNYIFEKVNTKIPFLEDIFYISIENIQNDIFSNGDDGENNKKLD